VICAALWPDPADPQCPPEFVKKVREQMLAWTPHERQNLLSEESQRRFEKARKDRAFFDNVGELRAALLDFIADFANWDSSTVREFLDTSRVITQAAHEALGGAPGTRPLVVDPFAGGGSIPLEALRVGADAVASDLNPVAVLLNLVVELLDINDTVISEYNAVANKIAGRLNDLWQTQVFAKFWSRTIRCEGPSCGVEIPLIRNGQLSKRGGYAFEFRRTKEGRVEVEQSPIETEIRRPILQVVSNVSVSRESTCRNGSVTCPVCEFTHKQAQVARQALGIGFGHRFTAIGQVIGNGKTYRSPTDDEERAASTPMPNGGNRLSEHLAVHINPKRPSPAARGMSAVTRYGYVEHRQLFSSHQLHLLESVRRAIEEEVASLDSATAPTVQILLAITLDRLAAFQNSFCRWAPKGEHPVPPFGKNGFPMIWDYVEASPFGDSAGSWDGAIDWVSRVLIHIAATRSHSGVVENSDSQIQIVPNDAADAWITDPPYYDSYPYADLSDFFYPILRAALGDSEFPVSRLFVEQLTPKDNELVLQPSRITSAGPKDHEAYRTGMTEAFSIGRLVTRPEGIAVIVFANKTTSGWEALLGSVCDAGWVVTASWPIDTERESRSAGQARLQSSVHLVCRPRENADGSARTDGTGDWRDVLLELPRRIHEWMPRLAEEGIVGADAIFACLGPALEIFSQYAHVERANGEIVALKEYLEEVWAAVAKEALAMIFAGVDATGFEEDARLTAMWLWTLSTAASNENGASTTEDEELVEDDEDESANAKIKVGGFVLEYDAARKIAQGLGAHLEQLASLIEVKGSTARLLPVAERTRSLFQKGDANEPIGHVKAKKKNAQLSLGFVADLEEAEASGGWGNTGAPHKGETVLDRVHQSMILFGAGRGGALKRFLVDDGAGRDERFWRLAQAFSALYPSSTDEKRWVDGVLARKRSLGF
jgi:adenine-specific DNA methylase